MDATGVASFNLFKIVVSGEAVDKSGDEVWDSHGIVADHSSWVDWSDWTNCDSHQVGSDKTGSEPFFVSPVCFVSSDVSIYGISVEGVVLSDGFGELGGVQENLGPLSNSGKIVAHVLAGVKRLRNLENNDTEFENSLDFVVPAALGELGESKLDFWVHHLCASVASLDFFEVVLSGHAVHEAAEEVWHSVKWWDWDWETFHGI